MQDTDPFHLERVRRAQARLSGGSAEIAAAEAEPLDVVRVRRRALRVSPLTHCEQKGGEAATDEAECAIFASPSRILLLIRRRSSHGDVDDRVREEGCFSGRRLQSQPP
jgi:hypothetical protein